MLRGRLSLQGTEKVEESLLKLQYNVVPENSFELILLSTETV